MLQKNDFVLKTAIRIYNALLTYYMHIPNPDSLSDEDWAERLQDLEFIRQQEKKASEENS
ncbi:hypothetical protein GCM10023210_31320 [Chryseobacterium ginsengisoli]|uniref:Uncharacterized protein n=1 Tax=Chryseobacterium ginsengisoli TaxID=363853 RepID=A0ABP9ML26_9FLAO